ncbi:MAG: FHA domain-containing protein [Planctomycetota bacterium]|nr:FHA domain-containing protein [Planctomycetota bacterium]
MASLIVTDARKTYLVALAPGETLVIGRAYDCDLPVTADRASRRHAEIRATGEGHEVVDLDSTNGTLVNGAPLEAARSLAEGDVVDVGGTTLRYRAVRGG